MFEQENKMHKFDNVFIVVGILCIASRFIIPKSGNLALLDEACDISVFLVGGAYFCTFIYVYRNNLNKIGKVIASLCVIGALLLGIFCTKDLVKDIIGGTKSTSLNSISVQNFRATTSFASQHYYLSGTNNTGEYVSRLELSYDDYALAKLSSHARVVYYPHTGRVKSIQTY